MSDLKKEIVKGMLEMVIQHKKEYEQKKSEALDNKDYDLYRAYDLQHEFYAGCESAYKLVLDLFDK